MGDVPWTLRQKQFKATSHSFVSEVKLKQRLKLLCLPALEESGTQRSLPVSVVYIW